MRKYLITLALLMFPAMANASTPFLMDFSSASITSNFEGPGFDSPSDRKYVSQGQMRLSFGVPFDFNLDGGKVETVSEEDAISLERTDQAGAFDLSGFEIQFGSINIFRIAVNFSDGTPQQSISFDVTPNQDPGAAPEPGLNPWIHIDLDLKNVRSVDFHYLGFVNFDNFSGTALPESSSWSLMIIGFAAIGVASRRRQRSIIRAALH